MKRAEEKLVATMIIHFFPSSLYCSLLHFPNHKRVCKMIFQFKTVYISIKRDDVLLYK